MRRYAVLALIAALVIACQGYEKIEETGRVRPSLQYSEAEMNALGNEAYAQVLAEANIEEGTPRAEMVDRVGRKIAAVVSQNYDWQFALINDDKTANAFCLPGGKVAVYTGILPLTENEDGLAAVLGHEIAHATLQHANERMSEPVLKRLISLPVRITVGMWDALSPGSQKLVLGSFGLGYIVGEFMPYSQEHEFEADIVGIRYVHEAGYDMEEAPRFWKRMAEAFPEGDHADPMSTHPPSTARAAAPQGDRQDRSRGRRSIVIERR